MSSSQSGYRKMKVKIVSVLVAAFAVECGFACVPGLVKKRAVVDAPPQVKPRRTLQNGILEDFLGPIESKSGPEVFAQLKPTERAVQSASDLDCGFDAGCCWSNADQKWQAAIDGQSADWLVVTANARLNGSRLRELFDGRPDLPEPFVLATGKPQSPATEYSILQSCPINCQIDQGLLQFDFWTSQGVSIDVCTKRLSSQQFDNCQKIDSSPAQVVIEVSNEPFSILLVASDFTHSRGGVALIDNVAYGAQVQEVCNEELPSAKRSLLPKLPLSETYELPAFPTATSDEDDGKPLESHLPKLDANEHLKQAQSIAELDWIADYEDLQLLGLSPERAAEIASGRGAGATELTELDFGGDGAELFEETALPGEEELLPLLNHREPDGPVLLLEREIDELIEEESLADWPHAQLCATLMCRWGNKLADAGKCGWQPAAPWDPIEAPVDRFSVTSKRLGNWAAGVRLNPDLGAYLGAKLGPGEQVAIVSPAFAAPNNMSLELDVFEVTSDLTLEMCHAAENDPNWRCTMLTPAPATPSLQWMPVSYTLPANDRPVQVVLWARNTGQQNGAVGLSPIRVTIATLSGRQFKVDCQRGITMPV